MKRLCSLGVVVWLALLVGVGADEPAPKAKEAVEATAFKEYLAKAHPKKKWQAGPTLLDSAELQKAYAGRRFVYVYSSAPLPPGANIAEIQQAYRERVKDIRENHVSLAAAVVKTGDEWKITPYVKAADFNQGLMKVTSEEEARVAAAAILSLIPVDQVSPRRVEPKEVKVSKSDKGWTCDAQSQKGYFAGTVSFNAKGECTAVSKNYAGPYPP